MLRDLILKDFWLKLASLVAAVFIWLTVSAAIRREIDLRNYPGPLVERRIFLNLPVLVVSSASDVRNFRVQPSTVAATVRGDAELLERLQPADIHVIVDLTGIDSASDLRKRVEVSTPPGVMHVSVEPQVVDVIFPPKP